MKTSTAYWLSALLVILAIGILSPIQAQDPESLFQQGLIKEEGEGSLQEAIDIYIKLASDESVTRPLQAKALLHTGLCYEKLGRTEAQKTYRYIINNYPDQAETVTIARKKLALLSETEDASSKVDKELKIRKVWEGTEDLLGKLSPDGKYICYTDWETGDLAIYKIASGKTRRLTNKGTWDESKAYAEDSRWAPDSRSIVYAWCNDAGIYDLRIFGLEDTEPRILLEGKEANYMVPRDWSMDGKEILALQSFENREIQTILISVADGSVKTVLTCEFWPSNMGLSSDGQYIVYSSPVDSRSSNRDIFCIKKDGSKEHDLIAHPADDIVQGWTPDGKRMLFTSNRDGSAGLYTIEVSHGLTVGPPILVKSGILPYETFGFSPEGSYYYALYKEWNDVYIAELDPLDGKKVDQAVKLISRYEGNLREPDYSPDGKKLAYITWQNRSGSKEKALWGDMLVIKDLESGSEQEFTTDYYGIGFPRWSPDGKSILTVSRNTKNEFGLFLLDVHSGTSETIIEAGTINIGYGRHEWSPDSKSFYFGQLDPAKGTSRIILREISGGIEKVIHETTSRIWQVFLSTDGKKLAFIDEADGFGMSVMPSDGGIPKELFRFEEESQLKTATSCSVAWSADNKYLFFILLDLSIDPNKWELCRIAAEGGEIEETGLVINSGIGISTLSVHPDGRHFAYSTRSSPILPAVWVIENFLPSD